ncbi:hypothetical protein PSPO01_16657 [Paraphaeosphaeria sporulosa]
MDLFVYYPEYHVLVSKSCAYAVAPAHLPAHIVTRHANDICSRDNLDRATKLAATLATRFREEYHLLDPTTSVIPRPPPTKPPFPDLKLYRGYQCTRCDFIRSRTNSALKQIKKHFNEHRLLPRKGGRPKRIADIPEQDKGPVFREVYCQRFFVQGVQASFFEVNVPEKVQKLVKARLRGHTDVYRALIDEQLTAGNYEQDARAQIYSSQVSKTEVSPWLEMTRWPRYFHSLNIADVAPLAYAANPITEPALVLLGESFDRIIERAHRSVCEDKISVFDQAQINSFTTGRSGKHDRMLMVKLAKSTFRGYKSIWKRLLCFVYRASLPTQSIPLLHRLTSTQLISLDRALHLA